MHHFPFHISDINHATARLSLEEFGALVRLYMDYLKAEQGQVHDVEELAFSIGARSAGEKKSLERVLKRFFTVPEASKRLESSTCEQIIDDYRASGVQSRFANLCRHWEKVNRGIDKPTFEQFAAAPDSWFESGSGRVRKVTGRNPLVLVSDSPDTPGLPLPDSQPRTNNQEPITKNQCTPVVPTGTDVPTVEQVAEGIYAGYPRKVGKTAAIKAIVKVLKSGKVTELELLNTVTAYSAAVAQWDEQDKTFIPHPATWFNRGSYLDDPTTWIRDPDLGAKKKRGGGAAAESERPLFGMGTADAPSAPVGWERAMDALFKPNWREFYPAFETMPPADQRQVWAWLEGEKKEGGGRGFECPTPCDWQEVWAEVFGELPCPATWAGVHDVARREIVARIERKKEKGGGALGCAGRTR